MKKLLMMAVMAFALAPSFSDTLTVPVGNGEFKSLGEDEVESKYSLKDANNDGYPDIVEYLPEYSGSMGMCYRLYMYNPKTQKFEKAEVDGDTFFYGLEIKGDGTIETSASASRIGPTIVKKYKWTGSKWQEYKSYKID